MKTDFQRDIRELGVEPIAIALAITGFLIPSLMGLGVAVLVCGYIVARDNGVLLRRLRTVIGSLPLGPRWAVVSLSLVVLLSVLVMGYQMRSDLGMKWGAFTVFAQVGIIYSCLRVVSVPSELDLKKSLCVLALAIAGIAALNLGASVLGISVSFLENRVDTFSSRFNDGGFRWQSPLLSAWQLSGIGRWALPVLIVGGVLIYRSLRQRIIIGLWGSVLALVLWKVEYRAALFPAVVMLAWLVIPGRLLRLLLCFACVTYAILAPWIFGSDAVRDLIAVMVPDWVLHWTGSDINNILTLSDRTEVWAPAIDFLADGRSFFGGQGHLRLDASGFQGLNLAGLEEAIQSYSFHQGFLDIVFIYGSFLGGLIVLVGLGLFIRGIWLNVVSGEDKKGIVGWEYGAFSIAMVAMSNCHDGFVNVHFIFYAIVALALLLLNMRGVQNERVKAGLERVNGKVVMDVV